MGVIDVILKINIYKTSDRLILSQSYYVEKILYIFLKLTITLLK